MYYCDFYRFSKLIIGVGVKGTPEHYPIRVRNDVKNLTCMVINYTELVVRINSNQVQLVKRGSYAVVYSKCKGWLDS
jgi:hypothetical protein